MISAPNIDPAVTAVTPTADPQSTAPLQPQPAVGDASHAAGFPAALQAQQNQGDATPDAECKSLPATIELAAKLAAGVAKSTAAVASVNADAVPTDGTDAPGALPPPVETATDVPKTGDSLPDDGNPLPLAQDLQALILSLSASPLVTTVTPPAPVSVAAPAPIPSAASPFVPDDCPPGAVSGGRAQLETLRVAIAGLGHPVGDRHDAAELSAGRLPVDSAAGKDAELAARAFFRTPDAGYGRPGDALATAAGSNGDPAGDAAGGAPGNPSPFQAQSPLLAPAFQPSQSTLNDLALLLQGGSALASPAPVAAPANPAAVAPMVLPATSDLPALKPLGDPSQWSQSLGDRLLVLADQGMQSATIRLQPEHLGPMEIRIQIDDGNAQVWFSAHHGETRGALQDAIPRLREMFSEQGLTLLQTSVDSGRGGFAERAVPMAPAIFPELEREAGSLLEAKSMPSQRGGAWRALAGAGSRVDLLV